MTSDDRTGSAVADAIWSDALLAAALFAVDPAGCGLVLRAGAGPVRDQWLAHLRALMSPDQTIRRLPLNIADDRLLGGLDLAATLSAGRPVAAKGLLAESHGGILIVSMAERLERGRAARIASVHDSGEVSVERDGLAMRIPARFGMIAFDEGIADDEVPPGALVDRLAFHLDLSNLSIKQAQLAPDQSAQDIAAARKTLADMRCDDEAADALCRAACALGIASIRAPLFAMRVARASAALFGRNAVAHDDVCLAARLVLAPRATIIPVEPEAQGDQYSAPDQPQSDAQANGDERDEASDPPAAQPPLDDIVLAAAHAAIPAGLLAKLKDANAKPARGAAAGKSGASKKSMTRGRPAGVRSSKPRHGVRLSIIETLRAAAPWQQIRRKNNPERFASGEAPRRVDVRSEDFRIQRYKERAQTTTIFVVDASGSSALHRLAEAKGAVELLLADCYIRRDRVALLVFRGTTAELLLPPTRSLVRAKRGLAALPGGGGTPLAAALTAAGDLAKLIRKKGETPVIVLMTDGRANIARDGGAGRARATQEALAAARAMRGAKVTAAVVDTSPQPQMPARQLADEMGAVYLALPYANSAVLSNAVRASVLSAPSRSARAS